MSLLDYLRVLRRGWWIILALTALGVLAAVVLTATTTPTYTATASVYVSVTGGQTPSDLASGSSFATQKVTSYASLSTSTVVLQRAAAQLGGNTDPAQLQDAVTAAALTDTSLVNVTATGSDAGTVAAQANAVAAALTAEAPVLDAPGPTSPVRLTVVRPATAPRSAVAPKTRNDLAIGLAAGLLLGIAAVVVADALSTKIRSSSDLPRTAGLATLTSMPSGPTRRSRHLSVTDTRLESFRQLRANLQFGSHVRGTIAVAGVTSASDANGVARQLAAAFAEIGSVVGVVDLDLRPTDASRSRRGGSAENGQPEPGIADVLNQGASIDDVVVLADGDRVHEVPAGRIDGASAQRLSTPIMREVLEKLNARFDLVVLACSPLVERSEAAVAAALAGNVLVVVESGETTRSEYQYAMEVLAGVRVTSVSVAIDHVGSQDLGGGRLAPPLPA